MSLVRQLQNHRLTTARIFYHLPDFPAVLQQYIWQDYDLAPDFPHLRRFLDFWQRELDGPLHSVHVMSASLITSSEMKVVHQEFVLH
ncbi:usg protein [Insolitispirillum peregrinum]|uniref:usg protein n=1 Tax=Insolitispirillum peregrinum TaxID=80876 RepID=UPI003615530C